MDFMEKTMITPVYIKEIKEDRGYQGHITINGSKIDFKFIGPEDWREFDKKGMSLVQSGVSQKDLERLAKENTSLQFFNKNGEPVDLPDEHRDILFPQIFVAYSLVIDSRIKGEGSERTFYIPLNYQD